jgi:hypothetical protein
MEATCSSETQTHTITSINHTRHSPPAQILIVALASATATATGTHRLEDASSVDQDTEAQATGFDGFGGFGGFQGFHQFNGLMSNAFGDLEGQFDSSGFNKEFAGSKNRKFDTGA